MKFEAVCVIDCWSSSEFYYQEHSAPDQVTKTRSFNRNFFRQMIRGLDTHTIKRSYVFAYNCHLGILDTDPIVLEYLAKNTRLNDMHKLDVENLSALETTPSVIVENSGIRPDDKILICGMDWGGCTHGRSAGIKSWLSETPNPVYVDVRCVKTGLNFVHDPFVDYHEDLHWSHCEGTVYQALRNTKN